jgi:hypothetical protein
MLFEYFTIRNMFITCGISGRFGPEIHINTFFEDFSADSGSQLIFS